VSDRVGQYRDMRALALVLQDLRGVDEAGANAHFRLVMQQVSALLQEMSNEELAEAVRVDLSS
jgi:hypothetical protein